MAKKKTTQKRTASKKVVKKLPAGKTAAAKKKSAKSKIVKKTSAGKPSTKSKTVKKASAGKPMVRKTSVKKKAVKKTPAKKKSAKKNTTQKKPVRRTRVKQPPAAEPDASTVAADQFTSQHRGAAFDEAVSVVAVAPGGADVLVTDIAIAEQERPTAKTISAAPTSQITSAVPMTAQTVARTEPAASKPVIFLAFANDRDDTVGYLRNLPDEARRLRTALESAEQAQLCEVVVRSNSTAQDIFKVFQDPRYRNRVAVLHYGGHANGYQLLLESAGGESVAADAGGLAAFLGQQRGLQLVFLNGCSTQQQTRALLDANVSAVISTSRAIDDQVATDFSHQFYQGLAGGATIGTAYHEAEAAVQMTKGGSTRGLYFGGTKDSEYISARDRWPWNLYLREGSESIDQWNLPEAVGDPLFGLPPLPEQDLPESPYRHLNWFTHDDAEVFFGRGHQIHELYERLTAPRTAPIMLFYGQSGVGKSSILDAGLIPRLERDYEVRYLRRTQGGLLDTLKLAFLPEAVDAPIETAWRTKEQQLGKPLIVFLDQVEELYTRPVADVPDELDQLLNVVNATFVESDQRPQGKLVLGFRKEWLAELEDCLVKHELPRSKVFLEPLDRRGIIEVVQGPARTARLRERYGLTVEDGLAEIIADDLLEDRDSAIAPTLQILLTKLWTKATEENYEHPQFSQQVYNDLKRDGILLRDFLNQQIAAFRERYPETVDSGLLVDIVALHTTALGTAGECTVEELQQHYAHLGTTLADILQQCQDLHLLTVAADTKKESTKATRLAHDTLAPLVREQFDVSDKPGQRARRILDNRSVDWEGDREGTPLDSADLAIVEHGARGTRALNPTEQRLLETSRRERDKRLRAQKNLRIAGVALVLVILVSGGFAGWRWYRSLQEIGRNVAATLALAADLDPANDTEARQQFEDIIEGLGQYKRWALPHLKDARTKGRPGNRESDSWNSKTRIAYARHRADAAIALFRLNEPKAATDLLRIKQEHNEIGIDPEPLSQFAKRCKDRATDGAPLFLFDQLKILMAQRAENPGPAAHDVMPCYALLLTLGEWKTEELPDSVRAEKHNLDTWYRRDPSSTIHGACGWLMNEWGAGSVRTGIDHELGKETPLDEGSLRKAFEKEWFVLNLEPPGGSGVASITFVTFEGDFPMAADTHSSNGTYTETTTLKSQSVNHRFAIGDRSITGRQGPSIKAADPSYQVKTLEDEAETYCTDLTMMNRPGELIFRLPTPYEWECACRAGAVTPFCFGTDESLKERYAGPDKSGAGALRPNLRGLFDVHGGGSVGEWCKSDVNGKKIYTLRGIRAVANSMPKADATSVKNFFRLCVEIPGVPGR